MKTQQLIHDVVSGNV